MKYWYKEIFEKELMSSQLNKKDRRGLLIFVGNFKMFVDVFPIDAAATEYSIVRHERFSMLAIQMLHS